MFDHDTNILHSNGNQGLCQAYLDLHKLTSQVEVRSSCVQNSLCPDFLAFKILYDQTFDAFQTKIRALKI